MECMARQIQQGTFDNDFELKAKCKRETKTGSATSESACGQLATAAVMKDELEDGGTLEDAVEAGKEANGWGAETDFWDSLDD